MLRADGPATATTLAARLGINTGQTSYHLRQLAQHGFVVDDLERGNGRDRWWRAVHQSTRTAREPADPADREAFDAYMRAVAVMYAQNLQAAIAGGLAATQGVARRLDLQRLPRPRDRKARRGS